ncbi:MAG: SpoIID/LytB domain-containing protein, partial [Phycisphaerales bacterium]
ISCQTAGGRVAGSMPSEPEVRIRIRTGLASTKLSGDGVMRVREVPGGDVMEMPSPLTVTAEPERLVLTDGKGREHEFAGARVLEVAAGGSGPLRVDGKAFPGRVVVSPRLLTAGKSTDFEAKSVAREAGSTDLEAKSVARGAGQGNTAAAIRRLDLIEVVPLEEYVAGVTASELIKGWPLAAYQVQAVCARTYALHERSRSIKLGRDFDLESTTLDQAYNGATAIPEAAKAVADTRGVVLSWQGRILRAYYSSTCGGLTASAADTWPTGPGFEFNLDGPIQSRHREHACQASPAYRWEVSRDRAALTKQIKEWGRGSGNAIAGMGTIASVRVEAKNADARPSKYAVTDDKGKVFIISAEMLRVSCNTGAAGVPEVTRQTRVRSGDLEMDIGGSTVTIRGRGFGHGVGMCQYCAKGFADKGVPWREMVLRFYPGAKLERAY